MLNKEPGIYFPKERSLRGVSPRLAEMLREWTNEKQSSAFSRIWGIFVLIKSCDSAFIMALLGAGFNLVVPWLVKVPLMMLY